MATQPLGPSLAQQYADAAPFPHIAIDDFFASNRASDAAREVRMGAIDASAEFYGQHRKGGQTDPTRMGPVTAGIVAEMNSPEFVAWLEWLTGIPALVADPFLFGGGVHQVSRGGFLKIHADFNWHARLQLYRRVNAILYLNDGWREDWGGNLELWPADMRACGRSIAPLFNRLVVFSTTDESFHGHPEPLACPEGVTRNSIALYYYSAEPAPGMRYRQSGLTNYQPRPAERFGARHLLHRAKLRLVMS